MAERDEAAETLREAEQASSAGDHAAAEQALRRALKLQEADLGLAHPDVANTLNNLGVACDILGRPDEAEFLYRRALGIARKTLPPDHPYIATSLQNLSTLYRSQGKSEKLADVARDRPQRSGLPGMRAVDVDEGRERPLESFEAEDVSLPIVTEAPPRAESTETRPDEPEPPSVAWPVHRPAQLAAAVAVVIAFLAFLAVGWRLVVGPAATAVPGPEVVDTGAPLVAPIEPELVPEETDSVTTAGDASPAATADAPPPPTPPSIPSETRAALVVAASGVVADARVCSRLVTRGGDGAPLADWRCDAVVESAAPGPLFFYTRVRSRTDTTVEHRWFRNERLEQGVPLAIKANDGPGYRTYSTRTVSPQEVGGWRVELRSADAELLHVEEFVVR